MTLDVQIISNAMCKRMFYIQANIFYDMAKCYFREIHEFLTFLWAWHTNIRANEANHVYFRSQIEFAANFVLLPSKLRQYYSFLHYGFTNQIVKVKSDINYPCQIIIIFACQKKNAT